MKYQNKQYVRWGDLDAFGHVNNATYLVYAQEARFAWSKMIEMVVARAEVDFIAPIYTGDIYIDVEIWVNKIGNSSINREIILPEILTGFNLECFTLMSATGSLQTVRQLTSLILPPISNKTSMIPVRSGFTPILFKVISSVIVMYKSAIVGFCYKY